MMLKGYIFLASSNAAREVHPLCFIKKPKHRVSQTIIMVDPKDWSIALEDPSKNTSDCRKADCHPDEMRKGIFCRA